MRRQGIDQQATPQVFLPHRQGSQDMMDVIVRTAVEPVAVAHTVQDEIQAVDKSVARFRIAKVAQELEDQTGERRFDASLVSGFALAGLLLSAIGIYVLLHYMVIQRTNEIGVRMALGATPAAVVAQLVRHGLTLTFIGAGIGLVGAWCVSSLLSKLLYGVARTDPETFGISLLLLILVAGLACWIPARRAAHIDPVKALRLD
jgi:ABC-type antimicrobial peptide transport system permease subunit